MRITRLLSSLFLAVGLLAIPVPSRAHVAVGISVRIGPPILPVYVQPVCPAPGYIWVPGYWAYGPDGYFWVPGTWVEPPEVGLLWTPGYWGWNDGLYVWYPGYWGPEVGFYGGINYGFGYTGVGFSGGYWRGGTYYYNRAVTNVNVTVVHNTYNTTFVNNNTTINRVSFNGGRGGTTARPTSREMEVARQHHISMTSEQTQHLQAARSNRTLLASVNHGRPDVAATPRPGEFKGRGAVETGRPANSNRPPDSRKEGNRKEATRPVKPPENSGRPEKKSTRTFEDRPPSARSSNAAHLNPAREQKQQREVDRLHQQQDAGRQKVQQRNAQEQQKLQQRNANQPRQEQPQRRQQQQTQQMQQKHDQQNQKLQERQQREAQTPQKTEPKGSRPPGK